MLLKEYQPTSDASQTGPSGRFALRVRSQAEDYLVDLPGGKTTIGSSPRCNVRIQRPGVHPLHCLISYDGDGLTARRWAADALLNGQPFEDAPLAVGDHLSLGSVDLDVVGEYFEEPVDDRGETQSHDRGREFSAASLEDALGEENRAGRGAESTTEPAPFSWGRDTIHHTTVWIGEEEEEAVPAPSEHAAAEFEHLDEPAVEIPAEVEPVATVVPAEAAREVFRQLQTATSISRSRSRKLLDALRSSREGCKALTAQVAGLANTKDELVAEYAALARERAMLHEQLATAEQRYAEWDHQTNQWEELRKEWETARAGWDHERTDWTRQVGEWEARLAGHVSRIEELEAQLAAASAEEPEPPQAYAAPFPTIARNTLAAHDPPAAASWPTCESQPETSAEAPAQNWVNEGAKSAIAEPFPHASEFDEFPPAPIAQTNVEAAEAQVPARERPAPAEPPAWERHTPAWESEPPSWEDHGPTLDDPAPTWDDRNRQPDHEFPEEPPKPETDLLPAVAQPVAAFDPAAPTTVEPPIPGDHVGKDKLSATSEKPQPASYIERFSPMFAQEETAGQTGPSETAPPAVVEPVAGKPRNMPVIRSDGSEPAAAAADNDESIEDYMAKLLQRVRGDRPYVAGSQAPPQAAPGGPPRPTSADSTAAATPGAPHPTGTTAVTPPEDADQQLPMLSELVRKGPVNERPKNLDALRALANESARHAIGVHASRKHRREAVTKFIVASLAGMTSLWLMMSAPDWRDLQFIAACLSLLIAAYWAGQVYGRLVEMHRAGDYDGPDDDDFDDLNPPLTIDV